MFLPVQTWHLFTKNFLNMPLAFPCDVQLYMESISFHTNFIYKQTKRYSVYVYVHTVKSNEHSNYIIIPAFQISQKWQKRVCVFLPPREHLWYRCTSNHVNCLNNFKWVCPSQRNTSCHKTQPFFHKLLPVFQKFLKRENSLLLQGKQLLVSFIK